MIRIGTGVSVGLLDKAEIKVEVWEDDKRKGTMSPRAWYYRHCNRWVTEYEARKRGWFINTNFVFKIIYSGSVLSALVYNNNPHLSIIPKKDLRT